MGYSLPGALLGGRDEGGAECAHSCGKQDKNGIRRNQADDLGNRELLV